MQSYADKIIDRVDPNGFISDRCYRHHCSLLNGYYAKDLMKLGRNLTRTILVDNLPQSYMLQQANGIPILSWYSDPDDTELASLSFLLEKLSKVPDVTRVIPQFVLSNNTYSQTEALRAISKEIEQDDARKQSQSGRYHSPRSNLFKSLESLDKQVLSARPRESLKSAANNSEHKSPPARFRPIERF